MSSVIPQKEMLFTSIAIMFLLIPLASSKMMFTHILGEFMARFGGPRKNPGLGTSIQLKTSMVPWP